MDVGWIRMQNFRNSENRLVYAYILTPQGAAGKDKILLQSLKRKMNEYQVIKAQIEELRDRMRETMWRRAGVVRTGEQLEQALLELGELKNDVSRAGCPGGPVYNLAWNTALNLKNSLDVSEAIVRSALARQESRGSHYRSDFPELNNREYLCNFILSCSDPAPQRREVVMGRMTPTL